MSKLQKLITSFEKDGDGWLYYGDVDPKEAQAEYNAIKAKLETLTDVARTMALHPNRPSALLDLFKVLEQVER